ncbi:MAG: proton-conducting transporter membrane subunit [Bacteroidota bacterium]|nr:proton-conducting transporter membrane subunit [Bacteroidota bacterium]
MQHIIQLFVLLPIIGFMFSLVIPRKNEKFIANVGIYMVGLHLVGLMVFTFYWLFNGHATVDFKNLVLFRAKDYEFFINLHFDKITIVYMLVGSFLTFLVTIYCNYYLHREDGYKRFFNTIMFFYTGYTVTIFSGNLETLFIGWEILGISSFLLIAFYRDRYLPVKNAVKVFSIYRLGDVGLILAMWACHHLFHKNITFYELQNALLVSEHLADHTMIGFFVAAMILVTAAAKSAQLPFSSWLPRAMEGPTPSSAIFYGSLSVHLGVFLLLRTYELWENQISVRILIIVLGALTSFIATGIARVQSSIKSQIAYASISQIGLIFIELGFGLQTLALIHFAGNAFLRTYQLLVSPSTVSYLIREQFYNFVPKPKSIEDSLSKKMKYTFYMLSLKEFNLETLIYIMWRPLKIMGRSLNFVSAKNVLFYFIPAYIIGLIFLVYEDHIPKVIHDHISTVLSFIGFIMVLKSYTERKNVILAWTLIIMNHFWIVLAVSFNEHYVYTQSLLYLSGIVAMGALGYIIITKLIATESQVNLNQFNGHSYEHPKFAFVFLLACLGLTGFPITPTFIGEDIIFTHIREDQVALAFFIASSLIIDGIAAIRIYARVFLGPHIKTYHEAAYGSS